MEFHPGRCRVDIRECADEVFIGEASRAQQHLMIEAGGRSPGLARGNVGVAVRWREIGAVMKLGIGLNHIAAACVVQFSGRRVEEACGPLPVDLSAQAVENGLHCGLRRDLPAKTC